MKTFAAMAALLIGGYLYAQEPQASRTETTTTTTTWNGTLVDAGCSSKMVEKTESTTNEGASTTKTKTEKYVTECPVTTTTTTFGLVTPAGKFVRFDEPSNTRVVETVKNNGKWKTTITEHKPLRVKVVGTNSDGDLVVVRSIE